MKLLLKQRVFGSINRPKYIIDIVGELSDRFFEDIAAAEQFVVHPKSIRKEIKLTDDELDEWNDFIYSVMSVIRSSEYKFKIINDRGRSKKSYAFYTDFYPRDKSGKLLDEVRIRFRISDHKTDSNVEDSDGTYIGQDVVFKSFSVYGKKYPDTIDVMRAVKKICRRLHEGDYSCLRRY